MEKPIDIDLLRRLLTCDPEAGTLRWVARTPDLFPSKSSFSAERLCAMWNGRLAGKEAFTAVNRGYKVGRIFDEMYQAHRVIWALHYGYWPKYQIDHIDGVVGNNSISNLRDVTNAENGKNRRLSSNNTSGFNGVVWDRGRWASRIRVKGKFINLGRFDDIEQAAAVRAEAQKKYGFHKNHGVSR